MSAVYRIIAAQILAGIACFACYELYDRAMVSGRFKDLAVFFIGATAAYKTHRWSEEAE